MRDLKNLTDKVKSYYELVETHDILLKGCIKDATKPCVSAINQSILLRAVIPEDSIKNTGFENQSGYRESLIGLIYKSLDEEVIILKHIRDRIYSNNEKLLQELKDIESLYVELKAKNLIDISLLNPCSPSLDYVLIWCRDIWRYYHSFYLAIHQVLFNLNFEKEETVNALKNAFVEDSELRERIDQIRSLNLKNFNFLD